MVSVKKEDRNPNEEPPEITTLQFTRVTFGVSSSLFLLNATITHHMEQYQQSDPPLVDKFLLSIYVDDLVSGSRDIESTYELYKKAKLRLATAGFKLRKFATNSEELSQRIQANESLDGQTDDEAPHNEEDQSYAKSSLGVKTEDEPGTNKVLGVQRSVNRDELQFDIQDVTRAMEDLEPTNRDVASATARFFDPLGVILPVTILFKMFCQELCKTRISWDETLTGRLLEKWQYLLSMMKEAQVVTIPRCLYRDISMPLDSARLV